MEREWLRFEEGESVVLGYVLGLKPLLRAIDEALPKDATLHVEGGIIAPKVRQFLLARPAAAPREILPNTIWPQPETFDLPLAGANLAGLRELAARHDEPEICDHLVVYRGAELLLWAHDAGDGYLRVARSLPEATVERLRAALGPALFDRDRDG